MKRLDKRPPASKRYENLPGVLDFAVFDEADCTEDEILSAIPQALRHAHSFDADRLCLLGCKRIRERAFFGDWHDLDSGHLLKVGGSRTADGSGVHRLL